MEWIKENIEKSPSFSSFVSYIQTIEETVVKNPTLCVETCKAFIEGICKTILNNKGQTFSSSIRFPKLVKETIDCVFIEDDIYKVVLSELANRISGVADKIGDIRNKVGFSSHGMDVKNPKLTETFARFIVKTTDTLAGFILNCYLNNKDLDLDKRIHYEDCLDFNEQLDELYPLAIGDIILSTSKALFEQDPIAYREAFEESKNNDDKEL